MKKSRLETQLEIHSQSSDQFLPLTFFVLASLIGAFRFVIANSPGSASEVREENLVSAESRSSRYEN